MKDVLVNRILLEVDKLKEKHNHDKIVEFHKELEVYTSKDKLYTHDVEWLVNTLCEFCHTNGFIDGAKRISDSLIDRTIKGKNNG